MYGSTSDINSISSRHYIFRVCNYTFYERFSVLGFLVEDRKIFTSEAYLPVVIWIGGETMTRDVLFFSPSKSFVASLNGHTQVSYSTSKGVKKKN